ncbi:MAG TPA: hypothetical protein VGC01_12960 [Mucilaginibacter sp.]
MYWCKLNNYRVALIATLTFTFCLSACQPDLKETGSDMKYFDLKAYFKAKVSKLSTQNRPVLKTVTHNGVTETKTISINNWERELNMFSESDINKPAWKDSYSVQNTAGGSLIYIAKDPELQTREIIINKDKDKVKSILIFNHTKNILYETNEKLTYVPDSVYRIEKSQHVKLMGSNQYDIKGIFN